MGRMGLAFKAFFAVLFHAEQAERIGRAMQQSGPATEPSPPPLTAREAAPVLPPPPSRSDALTLLETLQREARLIDFLEEDLDGYADAQVGAAVREVHRGCRDVLNRLFAIGPLVETAEGTRYEVTETDSAAKIRLVGKVVETRPATGTLVHTGWRAEKCDLPRWTGAHEHERIIAPAEVEMT